MDETEEITRPRRRGEPRPEPASAPAEAEAAAEPAGHEPEPAGTYEQADAEAQAEALEAEHELPEPLPHTRPQPILAAQPAQPQPAQPQPAQPQPVAEITRQCSFCCTQQPVSQLDDIAPLMKQCKDTEACTARAAASGMYPLDERELEAGVSAWENMQGALPR